VLWNCPTPFDLESQRISLDSYTANLGKYIGSSRVTTRHLPYFKKLEEIRELIERENRTPIPIRRATS